ncbi:MAG: glycosyltransferase [Candidatus Brocadiaceae bacterium]|nr:glycosyltransferase [Candidatus Brocadiaceae bacterium]
MKNIPLVSIITPSFNQGSFLEETIQSVLNQDYPNIEYIIIDGGSDDNSVEIIKKYQNSFAYWVSKKDRGQTHALIKGFSRARGEYITWLCSDDILEPSMISISVDYHQRHADIGATFGDRIRIDHKGNIYSLDRYPKFRPWLLKFGFSIPQETSLIKREAYDAVGGLDESLHMAMDYDLWCKISKNFCIDHIPTVLGRFRAHASNKSTILTEQITSSGFSKGFASEFSEVYMKYFNKPPSTLMLKFERYARAFLSFVDRRSNLFRKEYEKAKVIRLS